MKYNLTLSVGYLGYSVTKTHNYFKFQYVKQVTESESLGYLWVTGNRGIRKVTER